MTSVAMNPKAELSEIEISIQTMVEGLLGIFLGLFGID